MNGLILDERTINNVKIEAAKLVSELIQDELAEVILYGSCARGDYTDDSDVDIALIMKCDRLEAKKYDDALAGVATTLAMKYFVIVNFVCLPYEEFVEKKTWYAYFRNIDREGEVLYG